MALEFIRQIDELGRLVIPKDLRVKYGFKPGDEVYLEASNNGILIRRECDAYGNDQQNDQED